MKYFYLRLFATKNIYPPLIEIARETPEISRRDFLSELFMKRHDFIHRKSMFVFLPLGKVGDAGSIIVGRIGRKKVDLVNRSPEDGFDEIEMDSWRAGNVLIDVRDFADGQKVAFQFRNDVGQPFSIFNSLIQHINALDVDGDYTLEVAPVTSKASFWERYNEHKGDITSVSFTFFTPNVLRLRSTLNEELRKAKEKYNASRVTERLENKKGHLSLDGQEVRDAVEIVSEGGGSAVLKAGNKKIYDSSQEHVATDVENDEPFQRVKQGVWQRVASTLFSL